MFRDDFHTDHEIRGDHGQRNRPPFEILRDPPGQGEQEEQDALPSEDPVRSHDRGPGNAFASTADIHQFGEFDVDDAQVIPVDPALFFAAMHPRIQSIGDCQGSMGRAMFGDEFPMIVGFVSQMALQCLRKLDQCHDEKSGIGLGRRRERRQLHREIPRRIDKATPQRSRLPPSRVRRVGPKDQQPTERQRERGMQLGG